MEIKENIVFLTEDEARRTGYPEELPLEHCMDLESHVEIDMSALTQERAQDDIPPAKYGEHMIRHAQLLERMTFLEKIRDSLAQEKDLPLELELNELIARRNKFGN